MAEVKPSTRLITGNSTALQNLGLLQLNQTQETLAISQIGSPIPTRGFGQDDIELSGLSYLQKIHDRSTGGALHLEPGLWITQPATTYPPEGAPPQIVARMGSIPHGNALLAQGSASSFTGPPTLPTEAEPYAFSQFPSFNSIPFGIPALPAAPVINAVGSSEKLTAPQLVPPAVPFHEYDLGLAASATNPRTPFGTIPAEPGLPAEINGVLMQDVISDPASLLQAVISEQVDSGHTFQGVALNIATQATVTFRVNPDSPPTGPTVDVSVTDGAGGSRTSSSWRAASRPERRDRTPRPRWSTQPSGSRR